MDREWNVSHGLTFPMLGPYLRVSLGEAMEVLGRESWRKQVTPVCFLPHHNVNQATAIMDWTLWSWNPQASPWFCEALYPSKQKGTSWLGSWIGSLVPFLLYGTGAGAQGLFACSAAMPPQSAALALCFGPLCVPAFCLDLSQASGAFLPGEEKGTSPPRPTQEERGPGKTAVIKSIHLRSTLPLPTHLGCACLWGSHNYF